MCDVKGPQAPEYDVNQEREFYRYYHPLALGLINRNGVDENARENPVRPRASQDRALTAFAQLATLRLNCRRSYISFFDRKHQYIVAEATKSLSLENDFASELGDELQHGATIVPKRGSICEHTVAVPIKVDNHRTEISAFVVPDCAEDERFKSMPYVHNSQFRFYAGVSIVSPNGYRIGSYCVIDDKPRKGLANSELSFLKDMATTVMVHMDMVRAKAETTKGEQMVHGLGSFVEGKSTIDEWWMSGDSRGHHVRRRPSSPAVGLEQEWADEQYYMHHPPSKKCSNQETEERRTPPGFLLEVERQQARRASEAFSESPPKPFHENPKFKETSKQDTLSIEVKATFARATQIIRQALAVDGVCCFDAKAGHTFGGLIEQDEKRPQQRRTPSSSGVELNSSSSESLKDESDDSGKEAMYEQDRPCEVLGFSTVESSSINGNQANKVTDGMRETLLRSLLQRYPHGTILNFDENGHSPSEEERPSSAPADWPGLKRRKRSRKRLRSSEAKFLRKIFPNVRSMAIVPMWNSRQKFFSACIAWTVDPYRVLTSQSELSYLAAFGDSVMAEIARVEAKIADKAKSDFISSISHELRSPLHGILGSVECLQDSELDAFQENMVHTVETCGKTLLDTIDHLLDFAKINNFTRKNSRAQQGQKETGKTTNIALDVDVDLSVITEEVLETVFAGHDFVNASKNVKAPERDLEPSSAASFARKAEQIRGAVSENHGKSTGIHRVSVVVDINKAEESHWIFRTQAGAWRRILMNLFGNSLKYTQSGFVQVKLDAKPLPRKNRSEKSTVVLTVMDSGQGIAQDYLEKSLFVPFAQEDSLQPGTGLGLAITAAIIRSMGGTIEVKSEKGRGTEITVILEMVHAPLNQESLEQSIISSAARKTRGLKIGFAGFNADSFKEQPDPWLRSPQNASYMFMSSFHRLCQNWFGMDMKIMHGIDQSDADIFLTTEQGIGEIQAQLERRMITQSDKDAQEAAAATPLLVLCNSAVTANAMLHNQRAGESADIAEYISQPCGPRKLAKALALCLDRLEASRNPGRPKPTLSQAPKKGRPENITNKHRSDAGSENNSRQHARDNNGRSDSPTEYSTDDTNQAPGTTKDRTARKQNVPQTSPTKKGTVSKSAPGSSTGPSKTPIAKTIRNVLLVDDNKINLQLLVMYMSKSGHNFTTATNGQEAMEIYKEKCRPSSSSGDTSATAKQTEQTPPPFDFVLMDVSMPIMDGLESTRRIRAHERTHDIKPTVIIALTGLGSADAQQEAYSSGVNTFITKPVKLKELSKILEGSWKNDDGGSPADKNSGDSGGEGGGGVAEQTADPKTESEKGKDSND